MFFKRRYRIPEYEFSRYEASAAQWSRRALTEGPLDLPAATAAVAGLYALVELAPPRVIGTHGPLEALDAVRGLQAAGQSPVSATVSSTAKRWARPHDPIFEGFFTSVPVLERARVNVDAARQIARDARTGGVASQLSGLGLVDYQVTAYYDYCLNRRDATGLDEHERRVIGLLSTLLRAGVWDCCLLSGTAFLIPVPRYHGTDENGQLHRLDGPSISWTDGTAGHHVHGVRVARHVIEEPDRITVQEVKAQTNVEVRRIMMTRMGFERFLSEVGARAIDHDTDRRGQPRILVQWSPGHGLETEAYVEVTCPSTGHVYHLRVPPTIRTCAAAVAWTFGLPVDEYAPIQET